MKVAILCGGFGTRIRDVSDEVPKPMIPVGRLPILWHLMKYYASFGHTDFILCLGYKGQVIRDFFLNYEANTRDFTISLGDEDQIEFHTRHSESNWKITFAETGPDSLTGTRIKRIDKYLLGESNFMLTYGDGLSTVDLSALETFHVQKDRVLTVTGVRPPSRFGELVAGNDGLISEFNEKPQAADGRISGGFFVCKSEIFKYLNNSEDLVFEQGPMKTLVKDRQAVVFEHDGFWQCMDTNRDWQYLNELVSTGKAPWINW